MLIIVLISALKSEVYDYLECLEKINVDVVDIALASIGDYFQFRNKEFDKQVGAIINIGEQTTCVSIINKGVLTNTSTTYLGGSNVTNDIAYIYKIDKEKAKDIKEELNSVDYERVRWAPFLNIVMLLAFILGIFLHLAEIICEIKPINKLVNKIKKYMNMLNNFFNNIRLK